MGRLYDYDYAIRIPLNMIQLTERDGKAFPLAFDWEGDGGSKLRVEIDKVLSCTPCAEQKSGVVGDRYECQIGGRREYLYYSIIAPRKWFMLKPVTEDEYNAYYRLPGEDPGAGAASAAGKGSRADTGAASGTGAGASSDPVSASAAGTASNPGYANDPKLRRPRSIRIGDTLDIEVGD